MNRSLGDYPILEDEAAVGRHGLIDGCDQGSPRVSRHMVNNVRQDNQVEGSWFSAGYSFHELLVKSHVGRIAAEKAADLRHDIDSGNCRRWIGPRKSLSHGAFAAANLQYPLRLGYPGAHQFREVIQVNEYMPIGLRHLV